MLVGANLAYLGMSGFRSERLASNSREDARHVVALREDSDFLLVRILWGNASGGCRFSPIRFYRRYMLPIRVTRLQRSLCCKFVKQL